MLVVLIFVKDPKTLEVYGADFVIDGPQLGLLGECSHKYYEYYCDYDCHHIVRCNDNIRKHVKEVARVTLALPHNFSYATHLQGINLPS